MCSNCGWDQDYEFPDDLIEEEKENQMIQQVEVKRYNQAGQFLYAHRDAVTINQNAPAYPNLKTQLLAEAWDMRQPSDSKLDIRTVPVLFENKSLTKAR